MRLVRLGVEIALGNRVEAIEAHQITVGGQRHPGSFDALGRWGGGFPPWLPSLVSESTAAAR
ncbi:hypothetical protein [Mesorhizobium sp. LNHC209A00]|uniref:hypothetical protein n=1 Tax=Mesorhizobium TaxID=68287 RepID=UPI0003D01F5D|nr:hypothetical protein [Mesorhizobium sp. LNHC209A00]ESY91914.1 hypothetical protein X738_27980 [Mesorhizobium sp. LNHC209A00]